jgi:hypothetical protein
VEAGENWKKHVGEGEIKGVGSMMSRPAAVEEEGVKAQTRDWKIRPGC